ncbi:MAG: RsmE family RNA methyltransferase [Nanoarchaeota archaeon]
MTGHIARFYQPHVAKGMHTLDAEHSRHAKAFRLEVGDDIGLFDGTHEYSCRFHSWKGKVALVEVLKSELTPQTGAQITLAVSWPKGDRGDWLVEKTTELGAFAIIPLITKHTIVVPNPKKIARLQQLAIGACEQSGRGTIPTISEPQTLHNILKNKTNYDAFVVGDSQGTSHIPSAKRILILIGPEGGFSPEEITAIKQANAIPMRAASNTLRTETAAIALLTLTASHISPN